jgi:hypothetical protein
MTVARFLSMLAFMASTFWGYAVVAQDFRVDTDVFIGDEDESVSETLTIFSGDVVYDFFVKGPEETTVFDVRRGRIVLLDAERQVKTTLTTDQLLEFSAHIQSLSVEDGHRALLSPRFSTSYEEDRQRIELASDRLTYRAKGIRPKLESAAERFRDFADWYARLNAVKPGNLPPFGRIKLNNELASRKMVPEEIERTVVVERSLTDKQSKARSRHTFVWTLSGTDRKRIAQASRYMASFESVTAAEYWRIPTVAAQ